MLMLIYRYFYCRTGSLGSPGGCNITRAVADPAELSPAGVIPPRTGEAAGTADQAAPRIPSVAHYGPHAYLPYRYTAEITQR